MIHIPVTASSHSETSQRDDAVTVIAQLLLTQ